MNRSPVGAGSLASGLLLALAALSYASGAALAQEGEQKPVVFPKPTETWTATPGPPSLAIPSAPAGLTATPSPPTLTPSPSSAQEAVPPTLTPPPAPSAGEGEPDAARPRSDPPLGIMPARGWSIPFNVSGSSTLSDWPAVAVATDGSVVVVWAEGPIGSREIYYATSFGGGWSAPLNVSNSPTVDSSAPDVAADSAGGANIVWQEGTDGDPTIEVMHTRCVGILCGGTPMVVSTGRCTTWPGNWAARLPSIVVGDDGKATLTWVSQEPGANYLPIIVWQPPDPVPTTISACPYAGIIWMPDLAAGASGQRRLVYENYSLGKVYHGRYASGAWSSSRLVGTGNTPRVVVDSAVISHILWCYTGTVNYTHGDGVAAWAPQEAVATGQNCGGPPAVAIRADGLAHAVWESWTSGVQVRQSIRKAAGWTPPEDVSQSAGEGGDPALVADAEGNLYLFWADSRGGNSDIYSSRLIPGNVDVLMALSPGDWKMALSIRPTLRWDTVADAEVYRIRLYRSSDSMTLGPRLFDSVVVAAVSHDPDNPGRQVWHPDSDLTTGLNLSTAGYFWFVDAMDSGGDVLAASEIASFQIPPLGGAWEDVRHDLCGEGGASCYYPDGANPYWNQYDSSIYRWAEEYDIPAALLKALFVGESSSAIGPRRIGEEDFPPTRAYLYEPYVDWNKYDNGGTPCAGRTYGVFCLPLHPPTENFEELGAKPFPYNRSVPAGTTIKNYLSNLGWPFSDLGPWGLERIPGCAPGDPEECPAGLFPAQYRVAASYGLGQIVYSYTWWYLIEEEFRIHIRPGNPPSQLPPEALYDADLNVRFSSFLLGQKRAIYALCPEIRADSNLDMWEAPLLSYSGGGRAFYGDTVITRARNYTDPRSLVPGVTETLVEVHPHDCPGADTPGPIARPVMGLADAVGTEVAGRWVDLRGDGVPVWVSLIAFDTGIVGVMEGEIHVYEDDSRQNLLWQSRRIQNVNPDGDIREASYREGLMALADWSAGVHAIRTYPIVWDGAQFVLLATRDEFGVETDGIGSDGGGVYPLPDGSLAAVQQTYSHSAGERLVTAWSPDLSGFSPVREFVFDWEVADMSPPITNFLVVPEVNPSGWLNASSVVHLTATDDQAVESITYNLHAPDPQWSVYAPLDDVPLAVPEGFWVLEWFATDMSGNESSHDLRLLKVDANAPDIQLQLDGIPAGTGWYRSDVTVRLEASDPDLAGGNPGSGLERLEYSLDAGLTWVPYAGPFTISALGCTPLVYRAVDVAGNVAEENLFVCIGTPVYLPIVTR